MTSKISVWFGKPQALDEEIPENTIIVAPSSERWNDFGLRTRADFAIRYEEFTLIRMTGFIGFVNGDARRASTSLHTILESVPDQSLLPAVDYKFFSMLLEIEAYRRLVRTLGVDAACRLLLSVNDLVALRLLQPSSNLLQQAIRTEEFNRSFVRNSDSHFAFKNAGSVLRGLSEESIGVLPESLAIRFQMRGKPNEHELTFNFDHDGILPKRISVVIGKNGVGKSQTLSQIARAGLTGSDNLTEGEGGRRPVINRILAFAPTSEATSSFPLVPRERARIWYKTFSLNRTPRSRRSDGISDLIVELARSPQTIGEHFRWDIFLRAIRCISASEEICLITNENGYSSTVDNNVPLTDLEKGSEQRKLDRFASIDPKKDPVRVIDGQAFPLSSGEISFLKFAAQASLAIENGSLLLLDEPETHLHPNFISQFVSLLNTLLELTGSAAIIATHSVYFVREVFREQVTVLNVDADGYVQAARPVLRTFGADAGAISYFVFGEDEPSGLASDLVRRLSSSGMSWQDVYHKYKDELSLELLNAIRSHIESETSR